MLFSDHEASASRHMLWPPTCDENDNGRVATHKHPPSAVGILFVPCPAPKPRGHSTCSQRPFALSSRCPAVRHFGVIVYEDNLASFSSCFTVDRYAQLGRSGTALSRILLWLILGFPGFAPFSHVVDKSIKGAANMSLT